MQKLSRKEAYNLYLEKHYDEIVPFETKYGIDFIRWLEQEGIDVVEETSE